MTGLSEEISLSESEREIQQVARSHNWSLRGISIYAYALSSRSLDPNEQYSVFPPSDVEFQDATQNILKHVERVHPARAVIDALSEIRPLAGDALRYRRQILTLKQYFSNRNCTVLLLDDRSVETHDFQLESIAHGIITLKTAPRVRQRHTVTTISTPEQASGWPSARKSWSATAGVSGSNRSKAWEASSISALPAASREHLTEPVSVLGSAQ